jgi:hypothetical protein
VSDFNASRIDASEMPVRWAILMRATRRSTARVYRRWLLLFRHPRISRLDS